MTFKLKFNELDELKKKQNFIRENPIDSSNQNCVIVT